MNNFINYILKKIFDDEEYNKIYFLYCVMALYFSSFIVSIILYLFFDCYFFTKNKGNIKSRNEYNVSQICGFIIYSEKLLREEESCSCLKICGESTKLCFKSTKHCCDEVFCKSLDCCNFCDDVNYCKCCCLCCEYDEKYYKKKEECFCYCYKKERKSYWCDKFATNKVQKEIIPFVIIYFFLKLIIIAFEPLYEEKKNNHIHTKTFLSIFLLSFFLFFYFSISLSRFKDMWKDEDPNEKEILDNEVEIPEKIEKKDFLSKISSQTINGVYSIILFNGVFSLIFSSFYLSHKSTNFKEYIFENNMNIIFIPILMNKLYYFTLNYYCLYNSELNIKFDLVQSSSLISFYLLAVDFILWIIKLIFSLNALFKIQIIISCFPSLIILGFLCLGCFSTCNLPCANCKKNKDEEGSFCRFLFCLISFLICLGGSWYKKDGPLYPLFGSLNYWCCDESSCCYCEFWNNIDDSNLFFCCDCCSHKDKKKEED